MPTVNQRCLKNDRSQTGQWCKHGQERCLVRINWQLYLTGEYPQSLNIFEAHSGGGYRGTGHYSAEVGDQGQVTRN